MNHEDDVEALLQADAERVERDGAAGKSGDLHIDAYRLIQRSVRTAPMSAPPPGFAARMARHVAEQAQYGSTRLDIWLVTLALVCVMAGGAVFALPVMVDALRNMAAQTQGLPWPMLLVAALSLAMVGAIDAALGRRRKLMH